MSSFYQGFGTGFMVLVFSFVTLWIERERERGKAERKRKRCVGLETSRRRTWRTHRSEYPAKFKSFSCFSRLGDKSEKQSKLADPEMVIGCHMLTDAIEFVGWVRVTNQEKQTRQRTMTMLRSIRSSVSNQRNPIIHEDVYSE
jgi:hypothetical protein